MRPSLILLVLLSAATPLASQQQDDALDALLEPGVRVRITIPQLSRWTGRLHSVDSESLTLVNDRGGPGEIIHWSETEQVEVSRGHERGLWTLGGVVLGAAAGVIYTRSSSDESDPADIGGWMTGAAALSNVLAGMVVGGLAGRFLAPERWTAVRAPASAPRAFLRPGRPGIACSTRC